MHQQQLGRQTRSRAADDGGRRGRCSARGGGEAGGGGGGGLRGRDTTRTRGAIRNLRPAPRAPRSACFFQARQRSPPIRHYLMFISNAAYPPLNPKPEPWF